MRREPEVDVKLSMIKLATRRYPAYGIVCPPAGEQPPAERAQRILGEVNRRNRRGSVALFNDLYIVLENGAVVNLEWPYNETYRLGVKLYTLPCVLEPPDFIFLPEMAGIADGKIQSRRLHNPLRWTAHYDPDLDWLEQWIDRLAKMPVVRQAGVIRSAAELISLSELDEHCREFLDK